MRPTTETDDLRATAVLAAVSLAILSVILTPAAQRTALGEFEGETDVGKVQQAGAAEFNPGRRQYRVTGGGENIWGTADAFHFVWKKVSGDLALATEVGWVGAGGHAHKKAGWMVRQGLEPDSPYADAMLHGDGLISLQYREVMGGPTLEIQSPVRAPAAVRLERQGDLFSLYVARAGEAFQPAGSVTVKLSDPVYAGLAVCSHEAARPVTAVLSRVELQNPGVVKAEDRVLESSLEIISVETGERKVVYRALDHFEAPNWSRDGQTLIFNQKGRLYRIPIKGGQPQPLETGTAMRCNNDHGLSPDGKWLAISHSPGGRSLIYILPSGGGTPRQVTNAGPAYWHGWSPDGQTLAYCAERNKEFDVYTIPVEGGEEQRLTDAAGLDDGPDYSPDGRYIYFNSERTGVMRIWRMKADGSGQEQVTFDEQYADWFPHPSPDGKWLVFLSYDQSVKGHPPNKDVALRFRPLSGGQPKILTKLFGGQGTINVPSWSPDSKHFAFVSYRLVAR